MLHIAYRLRKVRNLDEGDKGDEGDNGDVGSRQEGIYEPELLKIWDS